MRPSKCMSTFIIPIWDFLREMPFQVSDRLFSSLPAAYSAFCVQWLLHSLSPMFYDHVELLVEILQAIHINVYDVVAFCCNLFICLSLPLLTAPLLSFWFLTYVFFFAVCWQFYKNYIVRINLFNSAQSEQLSVNVYIKTCDTTY